MGYHGGIDWDFRLCYLRGLAPLSAYGRMSVWGILEGWDIVADWAGRTGGPRYPRVLRLPIDFSYIRRKNRPIDRGGPDGLRNTAS